MTAPATNRFVPPALPAGQFDDLAHVREYLNRLSVTLSNESAKYMQATKPVNAIYLRAPNGDTYSVTVDNTGTLTATLVHAA